MPQTSKAGWVAFGIIIAISACLHLYRISYPASPVFDEAHFATYAADYVKGKIFFDIHPPLGKLIYALVLKIAHQEPLGNTDFVAFTKSPTGSVYAATKFPFGSYPYVPLRFVGIFFGIALAAAFYFFLRSIGVSEVGALLGMFFITFENALLLDTRLILMNGMYFAFGFAALAFWFTLHLSEKGEGFKYPRSPVIAGILFGLSLGVKLIGVVFVGPILIDHFFLANRKEVPDREKSKRRSALVRFSVIAACIFTLIVLLNFVFFSAGDTVAFIRSIGFGLPPPHSAFGIYVEAFLSNTLLPWGEYVVGGHNIGLDSGTRQSPWYLWPFMQRSIIYYPSQTNSGALVLTGNPAVWYASSLAVFLGITAFIRPFWRFRWFAYAYKKPIDGEIFKTAALLLGGYAISLMAFPVLVQRSTFLYHYFPAFLFGIGFLAWGVSHWLKLEKLNALSRGQALWLLSIAVLTIGCFVIVAPITYGF